MLYPAWNTFTPDTAWTRSGESVRITSASTEAFSPCCQLRLLSKLFITFHHDWIIRLRLKINMFDCLIEISSARMGTFDVIAYKCISLKKTSVKKILRFSIQKIVGTQRRPSGLRPFICTSFLLANLSHGHVDSIAPLAPEAVQHYKLCMF